jgi:putative transposase
MAADLGLQVRALKAALAKKMVSPAQRRELVEFLVESMELSERVSCKLAGLSRSVRRYETRRAPDVDLRSELKRLAGKRPRFGYRRRGILLRCGGVVVNHKRVWRVYREEGLVVRRKKRKHVAAAPRETRPEPTGTNQRWSMDFISDSLKDRRTLRVVSVVDDWSRFCPAVEVDLSLSAQRVVRALEQAGEQYGLPKSIVMDNGPEFTSRALDPWAHGRGIKLVFIRTGKPIENAYAESFNAACARTTTPSDRTRRWADYRPTNFFFSARAGMPARALRRR